MRTYLGAARFVVDTEVVQENRLTALVRLADGHIIKRKKKRDFVDFENDKYFKLDHPILAPIAHSGFFHRLKQFFNNLFKRS